MNVETPVADGELRVVQVVPTLVTGGLERVATALTVGLAGRIGRVVVVTHGGPPFEPVMRAAGIEVVHMRRPKTSRPLDLARATLTLTRTLRRVRPHVVHAHNPTAALVADAARRLARLPRTAVVTTYHGVMPYRIGRATRALAHSSDIVVGVGPTSTESLHRAGLAPDHGTTVFNAVEVEPGREPDDVRREFNATGADLIVTVGRYVTEKNHELLLRATALLAAGRPRTRALLVGVGPLENDLRARIEALRLHGIAELTGERADAPDLTNAADVFVLSSRSEGLPIALLEAMALGTPVVATAVGGVGDAITDGETGLLVPPGDPSALAAALERVLTDAELARRLTANARRFVEDVCTTEEMVARYIGVYHHAIATRG